jgi:hypothetical protein
VRCCRSNERCGRPRTVIHVAFRKRSAGASRRARPASRRKGLCFPREAGGLLAQPPRVAFANAAFCSRRSPYTALAVRRCSRRITWCSRRSTCLSEERRTKPKFVQPEVWPTPAGRTDLRSVTKAETSSTSFNADARAAAKVCCHPVVIGPRTNESVRLADRTRHSRPG